ncbi:MAG: hypothetical protein LBE78_04555 [Burkholderiaceae bacterium]|jgi:hypothetical protein|nr:hypothetical protein [Burkholderiaceae bacterium]
MPRTLVVDQATNLKSISATLLDARFGGTQADAAMRQLQALNPQVDLNKIAAGSVLFVPDSPVFKVSATSPVQTLPLQDFSAIVADAFNQTAATLKSKAAARAAARAQLNPALKSAAFKKIVGKNEELTRRLTLAQKTLAMEEKNQQQAQDALDAMSKAALTQIAKLAALKPGIRAD